MLKKKFLTFILALAIFSKPVSCSQENQEALWITIIVHGAITIKPYITLSNLVRLIQDKLDGTVYKLSVGLIRDDPYIWQTQAMQDRGLVPINMNDDRPSATATLFANIYDKVLKEVYPERRDTRYYTYGWSGLFSHSARTVEAEEFYHAIKDLHKNISQEYPGRKIHLSAIGYSHGGNIIQGAGCPYRKDPDKSFSFDEALIIGTPIQPETKIFASDPLFEKLYVFYSRADKVVALDFFSTRRFFSSRYFHQHSLRRQLPKNIRQVEIQASGPKKVLLRKRNRQLVTRIKKSDFSPGHSELWSFGWIGSGYRHDYLFNPLPIGIFLPYLKKIVDDNESENARHFIAHINACTNMVTLIPRFCFHKQKIPFLKKTFVDELLRYVEDKKPKQFSKYEYDARFNEAIDKVKADKMCEKKENEKKCLCKNRKARERPVFCLT